MSNGGLGLVLISPERDIIQQEIKCGLKATNNEAEYEALITGLMLAKAMGNQKLDVRSDSQLVVNQLLGNYSARDAKMISYLAHVKKLRSSFDKFNITQVLRLENSHTDSLANLGSSIPATTFQTIPLVYLQ